MPTLTRLGKRTSPHHSEFDEPGMYLPRPTTSADEALCRRLKALGILILVGFIVLLVRSWHLQVIEGSYYLRLSENNRLRVLRTKSLRGKIRDHEGHVLADNRAAYTLMAVPEDLPPSAELLPQLQALDLKADLEALRRRAQGVSQPIPLHRDLPRELVAYFAEHRMDFPGIFLEVEPLRSYPYGPLAAHLLGYLGEISEQQLQRRGDYRYQQGDLVGQYGLERMYEAELRGHYGLRQVEVDAFGRETQVLTERPPQPGMNLVLTLDLQLQQLAEHLLTAHKGAIIALDPRQGQVLAMASSPAFDPNAFATRLSGAEWAALTTDPRHPLHNRALQGQYPPGSVFKIVTAIAALEEGVITPATSVYCPGYYLYGSRTYRDWKPSGHGHVNLEQALAQSCDVYFYHVGQQLGIERIATYARAFGLGQVTGLAPQVEKSGLIPTTQWKRAIYRQPWYGGETLSVAIGQGYTLTTPLQILNMLAALANGGTLYRPYIVREQRRADGTLLEAHTPTLLRKIPLKPQHVAWVQRGLWSVVNSPQGTGKGARHEHLAIAGKTGTSQVVRLSKSGTERGRQDDLPEQHRDHAWFVAYAPFENPRIAVVILIEHAGKGGGRFAEYAKILIQAYLQRYPVAADLPLAPQQRP